MSRICCVGIAALDTIYPITTPIRAGEKHRAPRSYRALGGNAAIAALTAVRLGGEAMLLTRLGADPAADEIRMRLQHLGVDDSLSPPLAGRHSSQSAVIIEPNGDRSVFNVFDPEFPEHPDWLPKQLPERTRAVLGDIRWEAGSAQLFTLARQQGIPAVLDGDRAPQDRSLLDLASHVAFSMQGLRELTGIGDPAGALRAYAPGRTSFTAVTDGGNGVFAWMDGNIQHFPAFKVRVVDTLCAGDVWHGAFTLALAQGRTMPEAIRFASAAAALKCSRAGGGEAAPELAEVEAFLATAAPAEGVTWP